MSKLITAYVLCDVASHAIKAGQLLTASEALVKALQKDGSVDPHKDAVAAARETGALLVRSALELAAEAAAARRAELQAEIAKAQAALKGTTDDAVKAALEADIDKNRAELQTLG